MKFSNTATLAVLTLLISACTSAEIVSKPGPSVSALSANAPVNEASRSGIVKYLNEGPDFRIKQRRDDAYQKMHVACGGKYKIDKEGPKAENGFILNTDELGLVTNTDYWYIRFSCI